MSGYIEAILMFSDSLWNVRTRFIIDSQFIIHLLPHQTPHRHQRNKSCNRNSAHYSHTEGYPADGKTDSAIINHEKSLKLNLNNTNAIDQFKKYNSSIIYKGGEPLARLYSANHEVPG